MTPELFDRIARGHDMFMMALPDTPGSGHPKQAVARSATEAASLLASWDKPGWGIYYCAGHLREGETRRCKENIAEVSYFWADID